MKDHPPLQPTENPYVINEFGYVSEESAGFYEKFMSKYCNVKPEGYYLGPPSTTEMKVLKNKKTPSKKLSNKRKRVKSKATISDDDDDDDPGKKSNTYKVVLCSDVDDKPKVPRIKILLPVRRPEKTTDKSSGSQKNPDGTKSQPGCDKPLSEVEFANQPKRRYVTPPLQFDELLKLAEKKQHEPVFIKDSEFDFKRPMTRKEKALYQQKMEKLKLRKEKLKLEKSCSDSALK